MSEEEKKQSELDSREDTNLPLRKHSLNLPFSNGLAHQEPEQFPLLPTQDRQMVPEKQTDVSHRHGNVGTPSQKVRNIPPQANGHKVATEDRFPPHSDENEREDA